MIVGYLSISLSDISDEDDPLMMIGVVGTLHQTLI